MMPPVPPAILHVDMDAFYASVEERDDPSLRGKPLVVGGSARRGVVLAASYAVRPFGVRSAMPMARALRLCPHLVVVPPRFGRYAEVSEQVFQIFHAFTPEVEGLSLDEAFLDVERSIALHGPPEEQARRIKQRIRDELGLTASVGIAEVKFAAKIASDLRKPDGLVVVPEGGVREFLAPLPVSRLWGVGPKTEQVLLARGLEHIGDVAATDRSRLEDELGSLGPWLHDLANGIDERSVEPDREAKSIGAEETFEEDLEGEDLLPFIHEQALRVASRLRRSGMRARSVHLKVKFADFRRRLSPTAPTMAPRSTPSRGVSWRRSTRGRCDSRAFTPATCAARPSSVCSRGRDRRTSARCSTRPWTASPSGSVPTRSSPPTYWRARSSISPYLRVLAGDDRRSDNRWMKGTSTAGRRAPMRGFTIIELMVVVVIIGVLSTMAIPYYQKLTARARRSEMYSAIAKVRMQLLYVYQNTGQFPLPLSGTDSSWNPADPTTGTPALGVAADWKANDPDWKDLPAMDGGVRMRYQYSVTNSGKTLTLTAVGSFPGIASTYTYSEVWNGSDPAGKPTEFPLF